MNQLTVQRKPVVKKVCIFPALGMFMMDLLHWRFAFVQWETAQQGVTIISLVFMAGVPLALGLIKGERALRWSVLAFWFLHVATFVYAGTRLAD
jgi:hypothetical protein